MDAIKKFIVRKLFRYNYIGARHTAVDNLKKGLPGHFRGDVRKAVKELLREKILILKPTHYGQQVSLNPRKRIEIENYLL